MLGANPRFLKLSVFVCCMVVGCELEWGCAVGWSFEGVECGNGDGW